MAQRRLLVLVGLTLASCHTSDPKRDLSHPAAISASDIHLAGIPITATDMTLRQEVPGLRIDRGGTLLSTLAPGRYTFAATTSDGFVWAPNLTTTTERPSLPLSADCSVVRGNVSPTVEGSAIVIMARLSYDFGDKFTANIDSRGGFVACLPKASYSFAVDGDMVSVPVPVVVPSPSEISLKVYSASKVKEAAIGVKFAASDLESFASSLKNERVIGLGEANHGTADFYRARASLSLVLAKTSELRLVLLEADAIGMMSVDDYVMGGDVDVSKAVASLRFWITDIQEFLAFLADVRAYNARSLPDGKIHVLGVDAQRIEPPVQFLLDHRDELALSHHDVELLTQISLNRGAAIKTLVAADRAGLEALLERLESSLARRGVSTALEDADVRGGIAAHSIRDQLAYFGNAAEQRDRMMSEFVEVLEQLSGSRQAALWAHNMHIARQSEAGVKMLGQFLAEKFGEAYFPVTFVSYQGSGRAWDKPGTVGVIPHELVPTPPYYLESMVMQATEFAEIAWIRLDERNPQLERWLSVPRYLREFASYYDPGDTQRLRPFPSAFAGAVVVRHAIPSTPTATGIRMIAK